MNYSRVDFLLDQLNSDGADPFLLYAIAMEYMKSDPGRALEYLDKCRINYPDYLPVYYQLALLYEDLGNSDECKKILQKGIAIARDQNNVKILGELSNFLTNLEFDL